jgi:hypothetical protein
MNNVHVHPPGALLAIGLAMACAFSSLPRAQSAEPLIITSVSKQFVVRGLPQRSVLAGSAGQDVIYIDPPLLAVTCERVKHALGKELGWGNRWEATVLVNVHPIATDNEPPALRVLHASGGWRYRLDLPDEIDRTRLLQSIVETLLLEYANRGASRHCVELPPWLTEGLTAHLMQGPLAALALHPHAINVRHAARKDTGRVVRQRMEQTGFLTVDQLNWPDFDRNDIARADAYHHSAHLLVRELIRLRGGADSLCAMLTMLPEHLNWQTAFLRAFDPQFKRMLDVEKWWALTTTQIRTHDTSLHWSFSEGQRRLEEILYTPMEVRLGPAEMPHVMPVSLQTVINEWGFEQQVALLQNKLAQLQFARIRLPGELGTLADSYRATLVKYLRARQDAWLSATGVAAAKEAMTHLTALDEQRARSSSRMVASTPAGDAPGAVPLTPR